MKLKNNSKHELHALSVVIEGLMSIQSGDNPRIVREKLEGFLQPKERGSEDCRGRSRWRGTPGGGVSKKAAEPEKPENHERWIVSYADMLTLLFALFVVLYATSDANPNKLKQSSRRPSTSAFSVGIKTGDAGASAIFDSGGSGLTEGIDQSSRKNLVALEPDAGRLRASRTGWRAVSRSAATRPPSPSACRTTCSSIPAAPTSSPAARPC